MSARVARSIDRSLARTEAHDAERLPADARRLLLRGVGRVAREARRARRRGGGGGGRAEGRERERAGAPVEREQVRERRVGRVLDAHVRHAAHRDACALVFTFTFTS